MGRLPILDQLSALADETRSRLLLVLAQQELTVSELCMVLGLPQSTVSRHLRILLDGGWVRSRAEGTRRLYRLLPEGLDASARGLWELARQGVSPTAAARDDARRLAGVLDERRRRSREFFESTALHWDRLRDELFGRGVHTHTLLGLLPEAWTVADLGCGTGAVAEALAPFVSTVLAVDESETMLDAARERLAGYANVELRRGELESLPIDDAQVDAATLVLVLHHLADPTKVLQEVARVLRPAGRLLLVDLLPHDRLEYQLQMGHVWMGFSEEKVRGLLGTVGLDCAWFRPLPLDVAARGPGLFATSARRPAGASQARQAQGSQSFAELQSSNNSLNQPRSVR